MVIDPETFYPAGEAFIQSTVRNAIKLKQVLFPVHDGSKAVRGCVLLNPVSPCIWQSIKLAGNAGVRLTIAMS